MYIVCSDNQHLESKLSYLKKVFHNFNSYPHWFITKVINDVKNDFNKQIVPLTPHIETTDSENNNIRKPMMILPYAGEKGCNLIKSLKENLQRVLPVNIQICTVYTGNKLSCHLRNIKDLTPFEEQHYFVYHSFSAENFNENYIGESARWLDERIKDHNGRDRNFHLFKHSVESRHDPVLQNDFRIIGKVYRNNTSRRQITEALFINKIKPSLNNEDKSVKDKSVLMSL